MSIDLRRASQLGVPPTDKTAAMEHRKPGRKPRWDPTVERKQLKVRLSSDLFEAFHAEAKKRGMSVNDLVGEYAEKVTGVPYDPQKGLPLTAA